MNKYLLLLSGGVGSRFQEKLPKQYYRNSKGKMVLISSVEKLSNKNITGTVIVADDEYHELIRKEISKNNLNLGKVSFAVNGPNRHNSIINGLDKLKEIGADDDSFVILQEAVRPFVKERIIDDLISYDESSKNVAPGINPIVLYSHSNGMEAVDLIRKDKLMELQLPKRYHLGTLNSLMDRNVDGSKILDESEFLLKAGIPIKIIKGSRANIKITFIEDKTILEK